MRLVAYYNSLLQAHKTNLAVEVLSQLPIINGIEELLSDIYTFFCKSPKKHLEFVQLAALLDSKGNKILRNVKTRWLSMLAPAVRILNEYRPLLVEFQKHTEVRKPKQIALKCFSHLRDVGVLLSLACVMPMLKLTNTLMKYAQQADVFICDYLVAVKKLQMDLQKLYVEEKTQFTQELFWDFNALIGTRHDCIPMKWVTDELDLNLEGVEFLSFERGTGYSIRAMYRDPVTKEEVPITRDIFTTLVDGVKSQATSKYLQLPQVDSPSSLLQVEINNLT